MQDIYSSSSGSGNRDNRNKQTDRMPNGDIPITPRRRDDTVYTDIATIPPEVKTKTKSKKKRRKSGIIMRIIALLLFIAIASGATVVLMGMSLLNELSYTEDGRHVNEFVDASALMSSATVKNILLIGVDSRSGETYSRSDTMMLLSLNSITHKITLTSFMRDVYVDIPGEYSTKINASCAYGGPGLVVDTIECNFNIDIDNYILVSFEVFETIVDGIGGINVDVTEAEADYMHGAYVDLPDMEWGEDIHLNGYEALWYSRIRKLDSDFNRTERQRKVISAIIDKVTHTSPVKLYSAAKEAMPLVVTDLTKSDIISLGLTAPGYLLNYELTEQRIPADDTWKYGTKGGASVILINFDENIELLRSSIYGE